MRTCLVLFASSLVMQGTAASAKPPTNVSLPQSGKWEVNYDENACHLFARFGDAITGITMKMTSYQPGEQFDLTLFGSPFESTYQMIDLRLDFGFPGGGFDLTAVGGRSGKIPWVLATDISFAKGVGPRRHSEVPTSRTFGRKPTSLLVKFEGKSWRLETGSMDRPIQSLHACEIDLVKHWGFDPDVQLKRTRLPVPKGDIQNWVRNSDYPNAAFKRNLSGRVKFRLDIDATGAIASCHVLEQTSPSEFAKVTCAAITKRGSFKPALDHAGQPVRSFWVNSVLWLHGLE